MGLPRVRDGSTAVLVMTAALWTIAFNLGWIGAGVWVIATRLDHDDDSGGE